MRVTAPNLVASRYRLVHHIANGGMGEVWEARDEVLDRSVALKLLRPELAENGDFRSRFRGEAQAAARLSHPGAVNVFDYGERNGISYLVMELIAGEPISAVLRRHGTLSVEETMAVVAQTASVLAAAHGLGMVHRDVKPANLLLQPDGRVKVTDFGIAHAMDHSTVTGSGTVLGTVAYMSPEQVRGTAVSASSDVYSLGVVAYQCLTGHAPFTGDSPIAVARAHLYDQVATFPADLPIQVERLVRAMLDKDPSRRPPSARAVADAAARLANLESPWAGQEPDLPSAGTTLAATSRSPLVALALGQPRVLRPTATTADDDDWPTQRRTWPDAALAEPPEPPGLPDAAASTRRRGSSLARTPGPAPARSPTSFPTAAVPYRPSRWRRATTLRHQRRRRASRASR